MKLNSLKNDFPNIVHFLFFLCLSLASFFLPLKVHLSNVFVGVGLGLWMVNLKHNISFYSKELNYPLVIFTSLYWILVIGMIYTDNFRVGVSLLEKKLALLILPGMVLVSPITRKQLKQVFLFLIVGSVIATVYCYFKTFEEMAQATHPFQSIFIEDRFQNFFFTRWIPVHPAYLSHLLLICIISICYWFRELKVSAKIAGVILCLFFSITLLILNARITILGIMALLCVMIVYKSFILKKMWIAGVGAVVLASVIYLGLVFNPNIKARFFESLESFETMVQNEDQYHSIPIHAKVWYCAVNINSGIEVLLGQGTGDEKDQLRECYTQNDWQVLAEQSLDAHNEYLSSYVRHGVVGAVLWALCLAYAFYLAIHYKNSALLAFTVIMTFAAIGESILRGQVSLLSYVLYNCCYIKMTLLQRAEKANGI